MKLPIQLHLLLRLRIRTAITTLTIRLQGAINEHMDNFTVTRYVYYVDKGKTAYRRISRTGEPSPTSRTGSFWISELLTSELAHPDPGVKLRRLIYTYTGFLRNFTRSGGMEDRTRAPTTTIPARF